MRYLDVACRLLLAVVFIVAAFTKVSERAGWRTFVRSLRQLDQVPAPLVRLVAIAVVVLEVLVAVLLLVPLRIVGLVGFALAGCLLLAFTVVIGRALSRGNRAPCRCFGASTTPLGLPHLARNLMLVGVALLGLAGASVPGALEVPYALLAGAGGLVAGILVTAIEDIVALIRPVG